MSKLPRNLPARRVIRALMRVGFYTKRQRGSHVIMRRDIPFAQVVVPMHKSIDTGTLDVILEAASISVEKFLSLL